MVKEIDELRSESHGKRLPEQIISFECEIPIADPVAAKGLKAEIAPPSRRDVGIEILAVHVRPGHPIRAGLSGPRARIRQNFVGSIRVVQAFPQDFGVQKIGPVPSDSIHVPKTRRIRAGMQVGGSARFNGCGSGYFPPARKPGFHSVMFAPPRKFIAIADGESLGSIKVFEALHVLDDVLDGTDMPCPADIGKGLGAG